MVGELVEWGNLEEACRLFDETPERGTASWTTIVDGYLNAGEMDAAFELFHKVVERFCFVLVLRVERQIEK